MGEPDYDMFRRTLPFFRALSDADVGAILRVSRLERLPERSVLAREGEPASRAFMLLKGKVRLSRAHSHGVPTIMRDLYPGDVVGVIGLCDTGDYMNSAEAVSDVTALALDRDRFYAMGAEGEAAVFRLIRALAPVVVESTRRSLAQAEALFVVPDDGIRMMERLVLAAGRRRS